MFKRLLAICVLFAPILANAQYTLTLNDPQFRDATSNAINGIDNGWWPFPSGGICKPDSATVMPNDLSAWCVGTDSTAYKWDRPTQRWIQQGGLGANLVTIRGTDSTHLFSLKATTNCTNLHAGYGLFKWNGSGWNAPNGCLKQFTMERAGTIVGTNSLNDLYSTPDGINWTQIPGTWTYGSVGRDGIICAVSTGHLYTGSVSSLTQRSPLPPNDGSVAGCVFNEELDGAGSTSLLEYGTSGKVYYLNNPGDNKWYYTNGAVSSLSGPYKDSLIGLSSSGTPYHWNVTLMYYSATVSGSWTGCPVGACAPGTTHTAHVTVALRHHVSGGGVQHIQTQYPQNTITVAGWDMSFMCDMGFGDPADPECVPSTPLADVICSESHANLLASGNGWPSLAKEWAVWTQEVRTTTGYGCFEAIGSDPVIWHCYYNAVPACTPETTPPDLVVPQLEDLDFLYYDLPTPVGWLVFSPGCVSFAVSGQRKGTWHCLHGQAVEEFNELVQDFACDSHAGP
jgi:hypothetical protein